MAYKSHMCHQMTRKHSVVKTKVFADGVSLKRLYASGRLPRKSMFARLSDDDSKAKPWAHYVHPHFCVKPAVFHLMRSYCLSQSSDKCSLSVPQKTEHDKCLIHSYGRDANSRTAVGEVSQRSRNKHTPYEFHCPK